MSDLRVPGGWDGAIDSGLGPSKSGQASRRGSTQAEFERQNQMRSLWTSGVR